MELFLDLDKAILLGFEDRKSWQTIDAITRGIEAGDDFPPVFVAQLDETTFTLVEWDGEGNYGGHNRAVAHYIMGVPLRCESVDAEPALWMGKWDIRHTLLVDDKNDYNERKAIHPEYR